MPGKRHGSYLYLRRRRNRNLLWYLEHGKARSPHKSRTAEPQKERSTSGDIEAASESYASLWENLRGLEQGPFNSIANLRDFSNFERYETLERKRQSREGFEDKYERENLTPSGKQISQVKSPNFSSSSNNPRVSMCTTEF